MSNDLARSFLDSVAGFVDDDGAPKSSADRPVRLATIDPSYASGASARVTFDGETTLTVKAYVWVNHPPRAGERVVMLPVGQGYVINGALGDAAGSDSPVGSIIEGRWLTAPTGYLLEDGTAVSRTTYALLFALLNPSVGTFTVTIAAPGVLTLAAHGLQTGQRVYLTTTGALPTGLAANTDYWAIRVDANTLRLATSLANSAAGTAITTTGTQSGVHTLRRTYGVGNGTTTFNLPDSRGMVLVAASTATEFDRVGKQGGALTHTHTLTTAIAAWFSGFYKNRVAATWSATNTHSATVGASSPATDTRGIAIEGSTDAGSSLPPYDTVNRAIKF